MELIHFLFNVFLRLRQKITVNNIFFYISSQDSEEANARKRRALESRAKILAEMSKRQNKFSHVHERELKEIEKEEKQKHKQTEKHKDDEEKSESKTVAVGLAKTTPRWKDKL
jgi:hypothetical protein